MASLTRRSAALLVASLLLSACTGSVEDSTHVTVDIDPGSMTIAELDGVRVELPEGSSSGEQLRLSRSKDLIPDRDTSLPLRGLPEGVTTTVVSAIEVEIREGELDSPALVTFPIGSATAEEAIVFWEEGDSYVPVPIVRSDSTSVTVEVSHFSGGFLGRIDVKKWAKEKAQAFKNVVLGRAGVAQPTCESEIGSQEAGVAVVSDAGDSVKWCLGQDSNGGSVLRVANNRRTYAQYTYPTSWTPSETTLPALNFEAFDRLLGTAQASLIASTGRSARLVDGGDTLELSIPPGASGTLTVEISKMAWFSSAIRFGIERYADVLKLAWNDFDEEPAATWRSIVERLLGAQDGPVAEALRACSVGASALTGTTGSSPFKDLLQFGWDCAPSMMVAYSDEIFEYTGFKAKTFGAALSGVGAVVGTGLTAAHLISTGSREVWDSIASFGGDSDAVYDVLVRTIGVDGNWLYGFRTSSTGGRGGYQREATSQGTTSFTSTGFWVGCDDGPATATFAVAGQFSQLDTTLKLDTHTPKDLEAVVSLTADGRVIGTWTLTSTSQIPVRLDISGVQNLTLSAEAVDSETCELSSTGYGIALNALVSQ